MKTHKPKSKPTNPLEMIGKQRREEISDEREGGGD